MSIVGHLGRVEPTDEERAQRWQLAALEESLRPKHVPVVIGINWYSAFDEPTRDGDGAWWIGEGPLGSVRGGHAICVEPFPDPSQKGNGLDKTAWHTFYDQKATPHCVGFSLSRMMSMLNRERYDGDWLYDQCKKIDGIPDVDGTFVHTGCKVLQKKGPMQVVKGKDTKAIPGDGISAYRFGATQELLAALGDPNAQYVTLLNSWGKSYPERVRLSVHVLDRLIVGDGGEGMVVTDR